MVLTCNESFLNPSTSELLGRKFRKLAGRPTFKDKVGNFIGGVKGFGSDWYYTAKDLGSMMRDDIRGTNRLVRFGKDYIRGWKASGRNQRRMLYGAMGIGAASTLGRFALAKYRQHKNSNATPQPVNASADIYLDEGFIDDAKAKVSGAIDAVKNTIQRNVGNISNGINSAVGGVRNFANGVADRVTNIGNSVSNFATNVVGSKNVKPLQPQNSNNLNGPSKLRAGLIR